MAYLCNTGGVYMNWLMIIFGLMLCTIAIKSFLDDKKDSADSKQGSKRKIILLDVFPLLVGIGGILIGSGVFRQHMLDEAILWGAVLCLLVFTIAVKLWQ